MKRWFISAALVAVTGVFAYAQQTSVPPPMPMGPAPMAPAPHLLQVGDKAPEFSLPGSDGKTYKLSDLKGQFVVLAWYPKAFTGGCTAECKSFHDSGEAIKKFDVAYFMASVDDVDTNKKFAEQEQADFPMLSDPSHKVAMAYGVVTSPTGFASRWTFYIGPDGRIVYIEKTVHTQTAGADLAAKLADLHVKSK